MKAVIIGAGLGGLTFGALLARDGWQVEVIDRNAKVGGVCALAEHNGYRWEQGPLILGDLLPGEPVERLLHELGIHLNVERAERGIEMPDFALWRPDKYEGKDWRKNKLRKLFPEERDGIDAYYRFYDDVMELRHLASVAEAQPSVANKLALAQAFGKVKPYVEMNAQELVEHFFRSEKLQAVFTGILADFCASPEEAQGLSIPMLNPETAFDKRIAYQRDGSPYYPGFCTVTGGIQKLPEALAQKIEQRGGKLRMNTVAQRILVDHGTAKAVQLEDGTVLEADLIAAAGSARDVLLGMVGAPYLDRHTKWVLDSFRPMEAVFMVHLGVDYDPLQYMKAPVCYYYHSYDLYGATKRLRSGEYHGGKDGFVITVDSAHAPDFAPEGHAALTIYTVAPDILKDGDWETDKDRWADELITLAEQHLPNLRQHITERYVLAAPDYRALTHQTKCSFGGVVPIMGRENPAHKTCLHHLWFLGQQSENMGGIGNVMLGARKAYEEMLPVLAADQAAAEKRRVQEEKAAEKKRMQEEKEAEKAQKQEQKNKEKEEKARAKAEKQKAKEEKQAKKGEKDKKQKDKKAADAEQQDG